MAQHVLIFAGKVSWEGQSNGLPEHIEAFLLFDDAGANEKQFKTVVTAALEQQMLEFTKAQGMYVQRDQGQILDLKSTVLDRMFVPFKWIVYITPVLTRLTGELSQTDEDGKEILANGSVPVLN